MKLNIYLLKLLFKLCAFLVCILSMNSCSEDSCIIEGTKIATPKGKRNIETLQEGDLIYSYDIYQKKLRPRPIKKVIQSTKNKSYIITTQNFQLKGITAEHPVFNISEQRFKKTSTLVVGSHVLVLQNNQLIEQRIIDIKLQEHANSYRFFDLSLQGNEHNFFADNILVHNKQYPVPLKRYSSSCLETNSGICKSYTTFDFDSQFKDKDVSWYPSDMKCNGVFRESEECSTEEYTYLCRLYFYKEEDNRGYELYYDIFYYAPIWDIKNASQKCLDIQEKSNGGLKLRE